MTFADDMDVHNDFPDNFNKSEHFKTFSTDQKKSIKSKSKAESTHQATKVWTNCFNNNLKEKELPKIDNILTEDLPQGLEDFYNETNDKSDEEYKKFNSKMYLGRT